MHVDALLDGSIGIDEFGLLGSFEPIRTNLPSGIGNLAFALLVEGGTHPRGQTAINVPGIGMARAEQIFYRAQTTYLTSASGYVATRNATIRAAHDLDLNETVAAAPAVRSAWCAVGLCPAPITVAVVGPTSRGAEWKLGLLGFWRSSAIHANLVQDDKLQHNRFGKWDHPINQRHSTVQHRLRCDRSSYSFRYKFCKRHDLGRWWWWTLAILRARAKITSHFQLGCNV